MAYIEALKGYVTDVPEIWLKRKDGRVFHFDQLSSSNVTPDTQFTEVNGGWSLYPVAYLPGQSSMEMQFESAQFDAELFALANNQTFESKDITIFETQNLEVDATTHKATITTAYDLSGTTITINGLTESTESTPGEGEYKVGESSAAQDSESYETEITFGDTDIAEVEITIESTKAAETIMVDNQSTFVGEAVLRWPVYSSGEETAAAGVKGYAMMHIFKCRVTAFPGFDTSYKSAVTNGITVSTMDPHRADGAVYSVSFVEK